MFRLQTTPLSPTELREATIDPAAGGFCSFEGWVRNHHLGRPVARLEYEAYVPLAEKEGTRILDEARERFSILHAVCVHRTGPIEIGGLAVVVCVSAVHRDAAFEACQFIIDEVKARVPIWKKEFFTDGEEGWVRCDHCGH
ncbi:molybdopterin synthase catalytic subunit [Haloferula luteola]|uniref:Molybdopterin synthase catalytic subunit n=1 Tax=Haloferula luteola TaxID=595692 RepID=A0A840UYC9_9BACT|nr:molybdenum cofactor biosynthesis protein MoaE [Haloferula luteola]MBB5350745.1 molybdopterin synthase catalytic subunit [Haloferula luteola]